MPQLDTVPGVDPVDALDLAIAREHTTIAHATDRAFTLAAGRAARLVAQAVPGAQTIFFAWDLDGDRLGVSLEAVRGPAGELLWFGDLLADTPEALALDAVGGSATRNLGDRIEIALDQVILVPADLDRSAFRHSTMDPRDTDDPPARLVALDIASAVNAALAYTPSPGIGREVVIEVPGRQPDRLVVVGDDTLTVLVDGRPAVGVDASGPGHWPDGETWERLPIGGVTTERGLLVLGMSEDQFRGLGPLLGLRASWFGRWKGAPGELRDISLDNGQWSCVTDAGLDQVIQHVRDLGLSYEETRTTRYAAAAAAPHAELAR
ncbi:MULTISPECIES: hypothetical protein [Asanoa]|uniref:Uncharacterized protein n=2 Tax=Asanoa TaxID=195964 RepID=A0A239PH24_9ACTN|nr:MULTISPECIES: hypothetical protein [Asanoa]GIF74163.1 hypothetical protein Asi02nite_36810 [Asanoa siamensis]SNT65679.1 hypothetical protein SAMN05421812_12522 [Asanoa hainanensis]